MADIFISYASEDRQKVAPLVKALQEQGWTVFWDRTIPVGKTWDEIIEEELDAAKYVIVVWSKNSISSSWVRAEAGEGLRRKILVPVTVEDIKIPLLFRPIQAVRLINWQEDPTHPQFEKLISDLSSFGLKQEQDLKTREEGYEYRVGITDFDAGLTNLRKLAERLNDIQQFFQFECPTLPSLESAVEKINGTDNLNIEKLPESFHAEERYLTVDFVICLTKYPIAFLDGGGLVWGYFTNKPKKDERFIFISTFQLNELTKQANCTFEKGISFLIISQLASYFTELAYHSDTRGCPMDKCSVRKHIIKGLKSEKFCTECENWIKEHKGMEVLSKMLSDDMKP